MHTSPVGDRSGMLNYRSGLFDQTSCRRLKTGRRPVSGERKEYDNLGSARSTKLGKIKVAIIGVGNCASSLVQGVHKYVEVPDDEVIPGVMHNGHRRIPD